MRVWASLDSFFECYGADGDLHSFPTRRSSDLGRPARVGRDLHGLARAPAREDVALAATVELHVHGEGDRQVRGGLDAREQLTDPPAVSVVVELEHLRRRAGLGDLFDGPPGGAGEPLEGVGLGRPPRHLHVALGVEKDEAAHGRDRHRPREGHAEEARAEVDLADVDEDVLLDREAVEVAAVAAERRLRLGAAVAEVPHLARQALASGTANLGQRDETRGLAHAAVLYATTGGNRRRRQRPRNFGWRFSEKARTPS